MASLGSFLRERRERRGISLEEMARVTRVAGHYLRALETEDFASLPASVFTRGFIRAYCQVLREPPDEALARYAEQSGAPVPAAPQPTVSQTEERAGRGRGTVLVSFILLVVLGLALFAVTLALQSGREDGGRTTVATGPTIDRGSSDRPAPVPAIPGAGGDERSSPAPPPASAPPTAASPPIAPAAETPPTTAAPQRAMPPAPAAEEPGVLATLPAALGDVTSPYRLIARTSETTWIRVRFEDGRSTEENIPAGQVRQWLSNHPLVLTVGNAGGVTLELNGRVLPRLGESGAVITRLVLPPSAQ